MLTHLIQPQAPSRVVLLGAHGFVATHLRAVLAADGVSAVALGSRDIDLTSPGADAALAARLREGDSIVFLSALTPDRGKGIDVLMANLRMAESVASAVARVRPGQLVYVSSDAVYRDTESLVDERTPADSPTLYGTMHAARERMLLATLGDRTPVAVLRPTLLFGPGDTHNSYGPNRFMRTARANGRIALFGDGEEQRDHVWVGDVVRLVCAVLARRSSGVLNVVTGQSVSFARIAESVARMSGAAVERTPRAAGPILHRHFDPTALLNAFPDFSFMPREEALAAAWQTYATPAMTTGDD